MEFEKFAHGNDKLLDRTHFELGDIVAFIGEYGRGVASMCCFDADEDYGDGGNCYTISSYNLDNPQGVAPEGPIPSYVPLLQPTKDDLILAIETLETDDKDALITNDNPKTFIFSCFQNAVLRAARKNAEEQIAKAIADYNEVLERLLQRFTRTMDRQHYDCLIENNKLQEEIKNNKKRIKELEKQIKEMQVSAEEKDQKSMPEIFNSNKAQKIKNKLIDEGLIDTDWQTINLSGSERSIVAKYVSNYLDINEMWQVFGLLWNLNPETLRNYFNRSFGQKKTTGFQDRMKEIISSL